MVETILGVQFLPLVKLKGFHAGSFWSRLGPEWSEVEERPLIPAQFERFEGSTPLDLSFALELGMGAPPVRLGIRNAGKSGMIQVQRDRLHYNGLGGPDAPYPRYSVVREKFDWLLRTFMEFLTDNALGEIAPNQWEVTYVNVLPKGSVWSTAPEHLSVLKIAGQPAVDGLQIETADLGLRFLIPPDRGRLHVESRQLPEAIRMTLTARGPARTLDQVAEGLDIGRRAIVTAFAGLTSAEAQQKWEPE